MSDEKNICVICQDSHPEDGVYQTACCNSQSIQGQCLLQHLRHSRQCPLCRNPISLKDSPKFSPLDVLNTLGDAADSYAAQELDIIKFSQEAALCNAQVAEYQAEVAQMSFAIMQQSAQLSALLSHIETIREEQQDHFQRQVYFWSVD